MNNTIGDLQSALNNVQRFDLEAGDGKAAMAAHPTGDFVLYDDVRKLLARAERAANEGQKRETHHAVEA